MINRICVEIPKDIKENIGFWRFKKKFFHKYFQNDLIMISKINCVSITEDMSIRFEERYYRVIINYKMFIGSTCAIFGFYDEQIALDFYEFILYEIFSLEKENKDSVGELNEI